MRGVFTKVEERVAAGHKVTDEVESIAKRRTDFKRQWRVRKAKKLLVERFGISLIRRATAYAVVVLFALVALIVVEATGETKIIAELHASVISSFEAVIAVIAGLLGAVAAVVPSFKLAFASSTESNVSRGEVLFKEASMVKDQLGFLAKVKVELQELFDFLHEFDDRIVIVPIVDDLDRCITDGRNVKVLEAMQLILSVPGAPILSFLAVDSRIVVASIEEYYSRVFDKTNISGFEYIDKIVQIPFAIPEPPAEKVKRLLSKSLEGDAASPAQVAQRLKAFGRQGRKILNAISKIPGLETPSKVLIQSKIREWELPNNVTFEMAKTTTTPKSKVRLKPLVEVIENFWGDDETKNTLELDSKLALELVCDAAVLLGPYLEERSKQLRLMDKVENVCMYKEEAIEILCRATNAALEAGILNFSEASLLCMNSQAVNKQVF